MLRIMEKWQKGKHRPGIILGGLAEKKFKTNKKYIGLAFSAAAAIFQITIFLSDFHPLDLYSPSHLL